ncbi:hypothetical protein F5Y12DRAFT_753361 [Xylaria sp. FL1777]|nr:hypothetical protein F5Y12DRAFT_753361 [Xylaria sp. FL1777]
MAQIEVGALAVAVLAILFTFNPHVAWGVDWIFRLIGSLLYDSFWCETLEWRNVAYAQQPIHGPLVEKIEGPCLYGHDRLHCWALGPITFKKVMGNSGGYISKVRKPRGLPYAKSYIKTNYQTLLTYLLMTADIDTFGDTIFDPRRAGYFDLKTIYGFSVVRVGTTDSIVSLTKHEAECIMAGWPPFYREIFKSFEGHKLESILRSDQDVCRPGWIVALGLGPVQPTAFYIDKGQDIFTLAIDRTVSRFQALKLLWPQERGLDSAETRLNGLVKAGASYVSTQDRPAAQSPRGVKQVVAYPAKMPKLTKDQCTALINVFHNIENEDVSEERRIFGDKIVDCMARVVLGVEIAVKYCNSARKIRVNEIVRNEAIYIGDCNSFDL